MKNLKQIFTAAAAAALLTGAMFAAQAGAHRGHGDHFGERMTTALNLTADQQAQAKSIFAQARAESKPIRQSLKQQGQTTQNEEQQRAQLASIRAAAMTRLNAILTPDQQQKLTAMQQKMQAHRAAREQQTPPQQ